MSDASRGRALVVEDDGPARSLAVATLEREGFAVEAAGSADAARTVLAAGRVDVVVLDLGLPDGNGLDLLAEVRAGTGVPVLITSGLTDLEDRVVGLRLGADDYLTKPYAPSELAARVQAVLRRAGRAAAPAARRLAYDDGLVIDLPAREVSRNGVVLDLRPREFDVLALLASNPRRAYSREDLLRLVWNSSSERQTPATVTEHVRKLRNAVEVDPDAPRHVVTVRRVGYRFDP